MNTNFIINSVYSSHILIFMGQIMYILSFIFSLARGILQLCMCLCVCLYVLVCVHVCVYVCAHLQDSQCLGNRWTCAYGSHQRVWVLFFSQHQPFFLTLSFTISKDIMQASLTSSTRDHPTSVTQCWDYITSSLLFFTKNMVIKLIQQFVQCGFSLIFQFL